MVKLANIGINLFKFLKNELKKSTVVQNQNLGSLCLKDKILGGGAWLSQSVEHLTFSQVMISQFVSLNPALGSVLTAWSLEPASDSVSPSLSL